MPINFEQPTFGAGTPQYQRAVVSDTARNIYPAFQEAVSRSQQTIQNRNLGGTGLDTYLLNRPKEQYQDALSGAGERAAIGAADISNADRIRDLIRGFAVEDRDLALARRAAERKEDFARQDEMGYQQLIQQLIGATGGIGAIGGAFAANQGGGGGTTTITPSGYGA